MFSDTTGEDEHVETTHGCRHRGDTLTQAMHVHVEAEHGVGVTSVPCGKDAAAVASHRPRRRRRDGR